MTKPLRVGIVGAGAFGRLHSGKVAVRAEARLAAICDASAERAASLAGLYGARSFATAGPAAAEDFFRAIDALIVAAPAVAHGEWALAGLRAGKHVFIEKPVATTIAEAERLVEAARQQPDCVVALGHQERLAAKALGVFDWALQFGPLVEIESRRIGVWAGRGGDVSATLDLMIHDLDLVQRLAPKGLDVRRAEARRGPSGHWDRVEALLAAGDCRVRLSVSRMAENRERIMRLRTLSGRELFVDFLARRFEDRDAACARGDLGAAFMDSPEIQDPLGVNLRNFLAACCGGDRATLVSLDDGIRALQLAIAIDSLLV